jgi:hypothetical protein
LRIDVFIKDDCEVNIVAVYAAYRMKKLLYYLIKDKELHAITKEAQKIEYG